MEQRQDVATKIIFKNNKLDLNECYEFVKSPLCGAINMFSGTIRDTDARSKHHGGSLIKEEQQIKSIFYEAYQSMAEKQVQQIIKECSNEQLKKYGQVVRRSRVCVAIRLGNVPVSEEAIIISVSSVRRHQSHELVMSILESIKSCVAIWKKIIFADGTEQWDSEDKSEASWLNKNNE
jgi:molybdopterin synthase catalytic subunit